MAEGDGSDRGHLFGRAWVRVSEHDTAEGEVYEPDGDDVPLSRRPRERMALEADGSVRVSTGAGEDDRPSSRQASWRQDGGDVVIGPLEDGRELRILRHSPERLVVQVARPGR